MAWNPKARFATPARCHRLDLHPLKSYTAIHDQVIAGTDTKRQRDLKAFAEKECKPSRLGNIPLVKRPQVDQVGFEPTAS